MPSDETFDRIGASFAAATDAFRSSVTDAAEQVRAYLEAHAKPADSPTMRVAAELGVFATGHIDADRFAALLGDADVLDAEALRLVERSLAVLKELSAAADSALRIEVPHGADADPAIGASLARIGRAFGAARVAELVRTGHIDAARRDDPAAPFAYGRWTPAERRLAPPLVVRVHGEDLEPSALAAFLDGLQKIALIVEAPAPPAALASLITPGTFVMQTTDAADFARLAAFEGPGIGALVPEGCATFVHDPAEPGAGRLAVSSRPMDRPRALRRTSAFRQAESLALLDLLVSAYAEPAATRVLSAAGATGAASAAAVSSDGKGAPAPAVGPADTLAAWLLSQSGLTAEATKG